MAKNIVVVFTGGRGSGKTLSMSVEGYIRMLMGQKCFANYTIKKRLGYQWYKAIPVDISDLVTFNQEIRDGCILLDEWNLWCGSRGAASLANRLFNSWLQLLRKRNLSLFITTQSFKSLDKFIREQTDMIVECFDLSFRYSGLREGAFINQTMTDYSGYFTGKPLYRYDDWDAWAHNTKTRMLRGYRFFGLFDSWSEYDILEAMTKFQVERETKLITKDGEIKETKGKQEMMQQKVLEFVEIIRYQDPERQTYEAEDLRQRFQDYCPHDMNNRQLGWLFSKAGLRYHPTRNKLNYDLVEVNDG